MWRHIYMKHECYSTHTKHIRVNYSYLWSEVMPNRFFLFQFYWFLVLNVNRFFWLDWFLLWVTKNLLLWLVCEVEESCLSTQKVRLYTTLFYTYSCSHWRLCSNYIYIIQVKNNATYLLELTRHLSIITDFCSIHPTVDNIYCSIFCYFYFSYFWSDLSSHYRSPYWAEPGWSKPGSADWFWC